MPSDQMTTLALRSILLANSEGAEQRLPDWLRDTPSPEASNQLMGVLVQEKQFQGFNLFIVVTYLFSLCGLSSMSIERVTHFLATPSLETFLPLLLTLLMLSILLECLFFCFVSIRNMPQQRQTLLSKVVSLLAMQGDARAILVYCDLWRKRPKTGAQIATNHEVEQELERLWVTFAQKPHQHIKDVSEATRRFVKRGLLCRRCRVDLTTERADLFLAALHYLHAIGGPENLPILQQVAALPVPNDHENRRLLKDATAVLLNPALGAQPATDNREGAARSGHRQPEIHQQAEAGVPLRRG